MATDDLDVVASEDRLRVEDMMPVDRDRLRFVNRRLREAGLEEIALSASIDRNDVAVFREVFAENAEAVAEAYAPLFERGRKLLKPARAALLSKLRRGEDEGLPRMGPGNSMRRRHPHEIVSQVLRGGESYVIRVHPDEDLQMSIMSVEASRVEQRRLAEFDTRIRRLFH